MLLMIDAAVLRAMAAAGASTEVIIAAVEAAQAADEARKASKRGGNAERQQRFRDRRKGKKQSGNARNNSNALRGVTPPIEYIHTPHPDISSDDENQSDASDLTQADECDAVADRWNAMAKPLNLPTCAKMTGKRRKACLARIRSDGFDAIRQAIERVPKSAFLRGEAGDWAGASIDFLLRPDSVTKILEGKYDDRSNTHPQRTGQRHDQRSSLAIAIDDGLEWLGTAGPQTAFS